MPTSLLTVTPLTASGISHVFDNIPFNPLMWLDASKIAGISSGASLSVWTDSSTNGSHATQPSATSQPVYLTNAQNGLPVVSFGTDKLSFLVSFTSQLQPFSFGLALRSRRTDTAGHGVFTDGNAGLYAPGNAGTTFAYFGGATLTSSTVTTNAWVSVTGIVSGSSTTLAVSGTTFFGNAGTTNGTIMRIGVLSAGVQTFNGDIGEFIVYQRALTETERTSLETYLRTKWGTL